jgi:putative transposase
MRRSTDPDETPRPGRPEPHGPDDEAVASGIRHRPKRRAGDGILLDVCDGLTGLPEAINAVWPQTRVQTCIVHLIRASLRWVSYNDRTKVAGLLRPIYNAPTEAAARAEL